MRKKRGLLRLMEAVPPKNGKRKEERKVQAIEPKSTAQRIAAQHYDHGKAIELSHLTEAIQVAALSHGDRAIFAEELEYTVEPFDQTEAPTSKVPKERLVPKAKKAAPSSSPHPTPTVTAQAKPASPPKEANEAFAEDLKAILAAKEKPNPVLETKPAASPMKNKETQKRSSFDELMEKKKNEHKIFDKIAQSMELATSYDLGSIDLENRFDAFDKAWNQEQSSNSQTLTPQHQTLGTTAFLEDLNKMTPPEVPSQSTEPAPVTNPPNTTEPATNPNQD
ncbi:MAG: hypothetical protein AAFP19_14430 [Bacteroidota bacterium]